ncbi:hypothetical protein CBW46_010030 [Paenibacillus xerothermodurans]|uniref:Uncharacterized protein n=1 Tax=Paenibacillus xerothermodurans TaxID=1977292 RepID=A0A2W1NQ54_PAEXE|nr:hypothetical protein CBW46_010030 [Paenibacillus xerothermodurans]
MTMLNKTAAEVLEAFEVRYCTDVTGFGRLAACRDAQGQRCRGAHRRDVGAGAVARPRACGSRLRTRRHQEQLCAPARYRHVRADH